MSCTENDGSKKKRVSGSLGCVKGVVENEQEVVQGYANVLDMLEGNGPSASRLEKKKNIGNKSQLEGKCTLEILRRKKCDLNGSRLQVDLDGRTA